VVYWGEEDEKDVRKGKYNIPITIENWEGASVAADVDQAKEKTRPHY
jgi:hypothetical protein